MPRLIPAVVQAVQMFLNYYPFIVGKLHIVNCQPTIAAIFRRALTSVVPHARRAPDHDPRARVARDPAERRGGPFASPIRWGGGVSRARTAGAAAAILDERVLDDGRLLFWFCRVSGQLIA